MDRHNVAKSEVDAFPYGESKHWVELGPRQHDDEHVGGMSQKNCFELRALIATEAIRKKKKNKQKLERNTYILYIYITVNYCH